VVVSLAEAPPETVAVLLAMVLAAPEVPQSEMHLSQAQVVREVEGPLAARAELS
jgi:hypothetical protein